VRKNIHRTHWAALAEGCLWRAPGSPGRFFSAPRSPGIVFARRAPAPRQGRKARFGRLPIAAVAHTPQEPRGGPPPLAAARTGAEGHHTAGRLRGPLMIIGRRSRPSGVAFFFFVQFLFFTCYSFLFFAVFFFFCVRYSGDGFSVKIPV